jgi:hypothetical protein
MSRPHRASQIITDLNDFSAQPCGCGVVHLSFGPATLHVTHNAIRQIYAALGKLIQQEEGPPAPSLEAGTGLENIISSKFRH